MGILSWIILGLIVGIIAKFIMPGKDPGGIIVTILLGIAGAFVGGFIGSRLGLGTVTGFNLGSFFSGDRWSGHPPDLVPDDKEVIQKPKFTLLKKESESRDGGYLIGD